MAARGGATVVPPKFSARGWKSIFRWKTETSLWDIKQFTLGIFVYQSLQGVIHADFNCAVRCLTQQSWPESKIVNSRLTVNFVLRFDVVWQKLPFILNSQLVCCQVMISEEPEVHSPGFFFLKPHNISWQHNKSLRSNGWMWTYPEYRAWTPSSWPIFRAAWSMPRYFSWVWRASIVCPCICRRVFVVSIGNVPGQEDNSK